MTHCQEAINRYQKLLESPPFQDLGWAEELEQRLRAKGLLGGRSPVLPVLRPHLITRRQFEDLASASTALLSAIERVKKLVLTNPALLARMELLPAEKMLATVDPGYPFSSVATRLDAHLNNGSLYFTQFRVGVPAGVATSEALTDLFENTAIMREFSQRYRLTKVSGVKHLLNALLQAYRVFGGREPKPRIAIVEVLPPFQNRHTDEYLLLAEYFRREGYPTEVLSPDQLEYRGKRLRKGDFVIDIVYRKVTVQEFLMRYDLTHPLVRAYREGTVCVANSFRAELAYKRAIFELLTDERITASFPAAERKAIAQHIPWTRVVAPVRTTYRGETIDLPEFILKNRERLVLRPNDPTGDRHPIYGWQTDEVTWERALQTALREVYVVQERVDPTVQTFPIYRYGTLLTKPMAVEVQPHVYLGEVQACSTWLSDASARTFSSLCGLAPTFILEGKA